MDQPPSLSTDEESGSSTSSCDEDGGLPQNSNLSSGRNSPAKRANSAAGTTNSNGMKNLKKYMKIQISLLALRLDSHTLMSHITYIFLLDMKSSIKVETIGQSSAPSTSNSVTNIESTASVKGEVKNEIKVEEKEEHINNATSANSVVVVKSIVPNQTTVRPIGLSSAPNASVKEEEYDSSATVSFASFYTLTILFNRSLENYYLNIIDVVVLSTKFSAFSR